MTSIRRAGRSRALAVLAMVALGSAGCSLDSLLNSNEVPNNITDPALTKTPKGALAAYYGTLVLFRQALGGGTNRRSGVFSSLSFIPESGLLADELTVVDNSEGDLTITSLRLLPEGGFVLPDPTAGTGRTSEPSTSTYDILQQVRAHASQAIGLLNDFADPKQPELVGHAYALEAYADVFLNELYCSGVPLSTVDYNGDYTIKGGSTTDEVFTQAVALFDTALALAGDSTRFLSLAAVGKGRALLGLGDYAGAAAAVAAVPDNYRYQVSYATSDTSRNFAYSNGTVPGSPPMSDNEGVNGLDYVSSNDPRTPSVFVPADAYRASSLYAASGATPITLASGVEARLIEAEAALQRGDVTTWLDKLNALRTDGTLDGGGNYNPGTGGVAGLAPLADPGTADTRVDLLFRERAFWLFLTGHRQGDMRRLIHQYGRIQNQVYPTGPGPLLSMPSYGSDVNLPLPPNESKINPLVSGCISRSA